MKTAHAQLLDLSVLPEQARLELADFYQFLKKKYQTPAPAVRAKKNTPVKPLAEAAFTGMWKDRTDMDDPAAWVRNQREAVWSRHG